MTNTALSYRFVDRHKRADRFNLYNAFGPGFMAKERQQIVGLRPPLRRKEISIRQACESTDYFGTLATILLCAQCGYELGFSWLVGSSSKQSIAHS